MFSAKKKILQLIAQLSYVVQGISQNHGENIDKLIEMMQQQAEINKLFNQRITELEKSQNGN